MREQGLNSRSQNSKFNPFALGGGFPALTLSVARRVHAMATFSDPVSRVGFSVSVAPDRVGPLPVKGFAETSDASR
jgi:hypothetical protein